MAKSVNLDCDSSSTVEGYASVVDYELRTGTQVPEPLKPTYQVWLNDASALMRLHMGEDCAPKVEEMFPDQLTAIAVARVYRVAAVPPGVTSASVGATSVAYAQNAVTSWLTEPEQTMLDRLMDAACGPPANVPGLGELGIGYGGPADPEDVQQLYVVGRPGGCHCGCR